MENKSAERYPHATEFTLTPEQALTTRVKFYEKNNVIELSSDFTLPDYMPEIRKMLCIYPKLSPISRYIGNGIEFSGRIDYDIVYVTADGELSSAPLGEDFSFSVQPDYPSEIDRNGEIDATADVRTDSVFIRVTAPRKVNVKCRLNALARVYGVDSSNSSLTREKNAEKLISHVNTTSMYRALSDIVELSDEINLSSSTSKPINSRGNVIIGEVTNEGTRLNCRGELVIDNIFQNNDTGEPETIVKKLPFSQDIELPRTPTGQLEAFSVSGICGEITMTEAEDKYILDTELLLEADLAYASESEIAEDIFIPGESCDVSYRNMKYELLQKQGNATKTVCENIPLSELSLGEDSFIFDTCASIKVNEISNGGKELSCMMKFNVLSKNQTDITSGEANIPITIPLGADMGEGKFSTMTRPTVKNAKCRIESGNAICEAEVAISYMLLEECNKRIAQELTVSANAKVTDSGITVYYPQKGENLWSVAKKFGTTLSELASANDLTSFDANADVSSKHFLKIYC